MYYHLTMQHFVQIPKRVSTKKIPKRLSSAPRAIGEVGELGSYKGKRTQTGNSQALRFDMALFRSHPEFSGDVEAYVIAPGRMLVVSVDPVAARTKEDPVVASFLSFLAQDMERNPHRIDPLSSGLLAQVERLTHGMKADFDEPLGDEELL